ncbi:MAG TPA: hypothetical protein VME17_03980 [Bryobacteraceae bacterium]|nr:hypothetical protein [Bryobacteraceae bacterium]
MSGRFRNLIFAAAGVAALLAFTLSPVSAQPAGPPKGARPSGGGGGGIFGIPHHEAGGPVQHLADGHPDMQGYWNSANNGGAVFEVENHAKGRPPFIPPGKGAVVDPPDGLIPYQPWAKAKAEDIFEHDLATEPELHCYESGVPKQMYVQFGMQILQPSNYVVMTWEFMHAIRIIPTDGRPHIPSNIKMFEGDSVGHWEGDTLVVDTTNLNDRTWFDTAGNFHSDQEHVVERFTPVDTNTIKYEATVEDPKVLTRPFKIAMDLYRSADPGYEQMEYACIEGNRDIKHYTKDKGGKADVKE